jgi:hypothetical protein
VPAPWIRSHEQVNPFDGGVRAPHFSFPFALVALIVAAIVARRRRDRPAVAACSFAATVVLVGWISLARIVGAPYPYLVRWIWVAAALCWFAVGVALLPVVAEYVGQARARYLTGAVAAVAVVLLVAITVGAFSAHPPNADQSRAARALVAQAVPRLRALRSPVLMLTATGGFDAVSMRGGVFVGAVEHGIDARLPASLSTSVGPDRVVEARDAGTVVVVALADDVAAYEKNSSFREIARYDPLRPADRREYDRLRAEFRDTPPSGLQRFLNENGGELRRLGKLAGHAGLTAVFVRIRV